MSQNSPWMLYNSPNNGFNGTGLMRPQDQLDVNQLPPNNGPRVNQKARMPQSNQVISMEEETVQAPPPDYEAEMNKLYMDQIKNSQAQQLKAQSEVDQLGEAPRGILAADLSPLAGQLGMNNYQAPTMRQEYDKKKALLQSALEKGNAKATEDQLNYLKLQADKKKNDEAARLREMMYQQRGQNSDVNTEIKLSKDWGSDPVTKNTKTVNEALSKIEAGYSSADPASYLTMIYGLMRMQDPSSTVREAEFKEGANIGGWPESWRAAYMNAKGTGKITQVQKDAILNQARAIHEAQMSRQAEVDREHAERASRYGANPNNVVLGGIWNRPSVPVSGKKPMSRLEELRAKKGQP